MSSLFLKYTNFGQIPDREFVFTDGLTLLHGPSGRGKTSTFYALIFGLYGVLLVDQPKSRGGCVVEVKYRELSIRRQKGPERLQVMSGDTDVKEDIEGQFVIDSIFGTYDRIIMTSWINQRKWNHFFEVGPTERMTLIENVMGQNIPIEDWLGVLTDKKSEFSKQLTIIETYKAQAENDECKNTPDEIKTFTPAKTEKVAKKEVADLTQEIQRSTERETQRSRLLSRLVDPGPEISKPVYTKDFLINQLEMLTNNDKRLTIEKDLGDLGLKPDIPPLVELANMEARWPLEKQLTTVLTTPGFPSRSDLASSVHNWKALVIEAETYWKVEATRNDLKIKLKEYPEVVIESNRDVIIAELKDLQRRVEVNPKLHERRTLEGKVMTPPEAPLRSQTELNAALVEVDRLIEINPKLEERRLLKTVLTDQFNAASASQSGVSILGIDIVQHKQLLDRFEAFRKTFSDFPIKDLHLTNDWLTLAKVYSEIDEIQRQLGTLPNCISRDEIHVCPNCNINLCLIDDELEIVSGMVTENADPDTLLLRRTLEKKLSGLLSFVGDAPKPVLTISQLQSLVSFRDIVEPNITREEFNIALRYQAVNERISRLPSGEPRNITELTEVKNQIQQELINGESFITQKREHDFIIKRINNLPSGEPEDDLILNHLYQQKQLELKDHDHKIQVKAQREAIQTSINNLPAVPATTLTKDGCDRLKTILNKIEPFINILHLAPLSGGDFEGNLFPAFAQKVKRYWLLKEQLSKLLPFQEATLDLETTKRELSQFDATTKSATDWYEANIRYQTLQKEFKDIPMADPTLPTKLAEATVYLTKVQRRTKYAAWRKNYDHILKSYDEYIAHVEALTTLQTEIKTTQYLYIEQLLTSLNVLLNEIVAKLFEEPVSVSLSGFKMTKTTKKVKQMLNLTIEHNGYQKDDIRKVSVGQADRISLAFTLAVNRLMNQQFLILDEVGGSLDGTVKERMFDVLREYGPPLILMTEHGGSEGNFDTKIEMGEIEAVAE